MQRKRNNRNKNSESLSHVAEHFQFGWRNENYIIHIDKRPIQSHNPQKLLRFWRMITIVSCIYIPFQIYSIIANVFNCIYQLLILRTESERDCWKVVHNVRLFCVLFNKPHKKQCSFCLLSTYSSGVVVSWNSETVMLIFAIELMWFLPQITLLIVNEKYSKFTNFVSFLAYDWKYEQQQNWIVGAIFSHIFDFICYLVGKKANEFQHKANSTITPISFLRLN